MTGQRWRSLPLAFEAETEDELLRGHLQREGELI